MDVDKNKPPDFGGLFLENYLALFLVLMHLVQTCLFLPSNFFVWRFILNFLLVAILEWDRLWPEFALRPHT